MKYFSCNLLAPHWPHIKNPHLSTAAWPVSPLMLHHLTTCPSHSAFQPHWAPSSVESLLAAWVLWLCSSLYVECFARAIFLSSSVIEWAVLSLWAGSCRNRIAYIFLKPTQDVIVNCLQACLSLWAVILWRAWTLQVSWRMMPASVFKPEYTTDFRNCVLPASGCLLNVPQHRTRWGESRGKVSSKSLHILLLYRWMYFENSQICRFCTNLSPWLLLY